MNDYQRKFERDRRMRDYGRSMANVMQQRDDAYTENRYLREALRDVRDTAHDDERARIVNEALARRAYRKDFG